MINVLVFPCASGVGQEVFNALKYHKDIRIYGANSGEMNPGSILFGNSYIGNAPPMSQRDSCIRWLNNIIEKYTIECIFPAYDDAQLWLKINEECFKSVKIITSSLDTAQLCRSKKRTYELFDSIIRCPIMYYTVDSIKEYPVFIKPECGEGAKGCHIIHTNEELVNTMRAEHIIVEYLPGDEYTIDCFTDINRKLCFAGARIRSLTRAGISILTESVSDDTREFLNMAESINNTIQFVGAWFFQVKRAKNGDLCLMEISPRISGAMFLYREQGVNFPLLSIYAHKGLPTNIVINKQLVNVIGCKIYTNNFYIKQFISQPIVGLYIDFDDTLILPDTKQVNPNMIALLYEAKRSNISIYLITRHKGNVLDALEQVNIHKNIFNDIFHIIDKSNKKDYITQSPAIFIDDSFSERNSVANMADVFAFDVDSHEIVRDIIRISNCSSTNVCRD